MPTPSKPRPRGIRRDRDCLTCKSRGVKCDLNRPVCLPCFQAGLVCAGYQLRVVWADTRKKRRSGRKTSRGQKSANESSQPSTVMPLVPNFHGFLRQLKTSFEHLTLKRTATEDSKYASDLISGVWDFASTRFQDFLQPEKMRSLDSIQLYNKVVGGLSEAVSIGHPAAIFGIATFAFFEVCEGIFGEYKCHLQGARSLMDLHAHTKEDLEALSLSFPGIPEIFAQLCWFDVMGAIIRRDHTLVFEDWHRETVTDSFISVVGCPRPTFMRLAELAKELPGSQVIQLGLDAIDLLAEIELDSTDRALAANVWRYAVVIAILCESDMSLYYLNSSTLVALLNKMCQILELIPATSPFFRHLAAAVFIAGINARDSKHRQTIRRFWQRCSFGNLHYYPGALQRCEEAWRNEP